MSSTQNQSKEFFELITAIGDCKSKQEEDKIMSNEVATLKSRLHESGITSKRMKEYLIRLVYCEMLGFNAEFGYIHAVNMTSQQNLMDKRIGYLVSSLCLDPNHELLLLLVSGLQRDLKSSNYMEVCTALTACTKLCNEETVPALLSYVVPLLSHQNEFVRKKAVMALHAFSRKVPSVLEELMVNVRRILCDKDPSVMAATLTLLYDIVKEDTVGNKDLVQSFVEILRQVIDHRLPAEYDYHRVPAPWIQIVLLKILAILGEDDKAASEQMYEVVADALRRADSGINISYAIIYESIRTVSTIYPSTELLESCAQHISRFISSENHNLKYLGIKALSNMVMIDPKFAADHQMAVIDCLESKDETLKRKTIDLLYRMTNPANVTVIVDKLVQFLRGTTDAVLKRDLVSKITTLSEKFSPDNKWYIDTMNEVFILGGNMVASKVVQNVLRLIAEGSGEDEEEDEELRLYSVNTYYEMLDNESLPDILIQVISWVLGEYGYLADEFTKEEIMEKLCELIEMPLDDIETRGWIITALTKLVAQSATVPEDVQDVVEKYCNSRSVNVQQRCYEFLELVKDMDLMNEVLPLDGSCEEIEVDPDLSFLDSFVKRHVKEHGGKRYTLKMKEAFLKNYSSYGISNAGAKTGPRLLIQAYEAPKDQLKVPADYVETNFADVQEKPRDIDRDTGLVPMSGQVEETGTTGLKKVKAGKWGKGGYSKPTATVQTATNTSTTTPTLEDVQPAQEAPTAMFAASVEPNKKPEPKPSPVQEVDKKQLAKEKLAADFFSGVSSKSAGGKRKIIPKGGKKKETTAKKSTKETKTKTKTTADSAREQSTSSTTGGETLIDFGDFGGTSNASQTSGQPAQGNTQSGDFFEDLFGGSSSAQPAPVSSPPPSTSNSGGLDLFGGLNTQSNSTPLDLPLGNFTLSPSKSSLFSKYSEYQKVYEKPVDACNDFRMKLTYNKALGEKEIVLMLTLTNASWFSFANVTLSLTTPSKFSTTIEHDSAGSRSGNVISFPELSTNQSSEIALVMTMEELGFGNVVSGFVSYTDDQRKPQILNFTVPITIQDVLRPHKISTQEYAKLWGSHTSESKTNIPNAVATAEQFLSLLETKANISRVEIIGMEGIASGKMISKNLHVLAHGKISPSKGIILTVRSKQKALSDAVLKYITQLVQK